MKQNISTKISQSSEEVKVEDVTQELQAQIYNLENENQTANDLIKQQQQTINNLAD